MKNDPNRCIRVLADVHQINECREDISRTNQPLKTLAGILNLAGNEVRLKILFLLYKEKELCPCDLSDILGMKVPAISQHLRKMKDGGVVTDKKVGQTIFYSIATENTKMIMPILKKLNAFNKKALVI